MQLSKFYAPFIDELTDRHLFVCLKDQPDVILIDSNHSRFQVSLQLIQLIRSKKSSISILHLFQDDHYRSRVQSLQSSVDDVLSLPFAYEELDARLDSLFRRASMGANHLDGAVLRHTDLELNTDTREVIRDGISAKLTVKEYDLLVYFLQNPGMVLARKTIMNNVWGQSWTGDDNLLDVYIRYLRKKIERPKLEKLILTVRGVGYILK